ncbi:uncharacterized protein yc1106_03730 [Curvularia clavata]|uniref:Uncharacterized protein n=1 Tax=Curvularia clavata TaxID=95742 RepID=A0A9Q8Z5Z6_CURCL|nr:uncharacterized protein yc1106_03730 [Curvularia clavata]
MASKEPDAKVNLSASMSSPSNEPTTPNEKSIPDSIKSFQEFLSFVLSLSIFGASTFAVIVSEIANPNDLRPSPRFSRETVRNFLGIAWLLFVFALAVVAASMSILSYQQENSRIGFDSLWRRTWERLGLIASSLIQISVIAAFLFLSLALVAYTEAVGWVAVALSSITAAFAFVSLAAQWITQAKHPNAKPAYNPIHLTRAD